MWVGKVLLLGERFGNNTRQYEGPVLKMIDTEIRDNAEKLHMKKTKGR